MLALDLVNPILTWSIRLAAATNTTSGAAAAAAALLLNERYHAILCAAPSAVRPYAARAALLHFPFSIPAAAATASDRGASSTPPPPPLLTAIDRASLCGHLEVLSVYAQLVNRHSIPGRYLPMHTYNAIDLLLDKEPVDEAKVMRVLQWWSSNAKHAGTKLRLKVSHKLIDAACRLGLIPVLDWYLATLPSPASMASVFANAMDLASEHGHVPLLDWLHEHLPAANIGAFYTANAINRASKRAHLGVLDWWLRSTLPLKFSNLAIDLAPTTQVLDWWLRSGLKLRYSAIAMDRAASISVLDWWRRSGLEMQHAQPMELASGAGRVDVLDWWMAHMEPVFTPEMCLVDALAAGHIGVLEWWTEVAESKYGIRVGTVEDIGSYLCAAADEGQTEVLAWWLRRLNEEQRALLMDEEYVEEWNVLEFATPKGNVDILNMWKQAGLPMVSCSPWFLAVAAEQGHLKVLQWWYALLNRGTFSKEVFAILLPIWSKAGHGGHLPVIQWLLETKLGSTDLADLATESAALAGLVTGAIEGGHVHVLQWLAARVPDLLSIPSVVAESAEFIDTASRLGHVPILRWLSAHAPSAQPLQYSRTALVAATKRGHLGVLRWWMDESTWPLKFDLNEVLDVAIENGQMWAWYFWLQHGDWRRVQAYVPSEEVVKAAVEGKSWDVLEWMVEKKGRKRPSQVGEWEAWWAVLNHA